MPDYGPIEDVFREFGPPYFVVARQQYELGQSVSIGGQPFVFAREVPIETARNHWLSLLKEQWYWDEMAGYPYAYELVTD